MPARRPRRAIPRRSRRALPLPAARHSPRPRRALSRRGHVYPVALAVTAVAFCYLLLGARAATPFRVLAGRTGQGMPFVLGLRAGRVRGLVTSLSAKCSDGTTWSAKWSPTEGKPVHFITAAGSFSALEASQTSNADGTAGQISFRVRGRLTDARAAHGTVRLIARFRRGALKTAACDSLDVPWGVGPR
jgi:hypothetical protein